MSWGGGRLGVWVWRGHDPEPGEQIGELEDPDRSTASGLVGFMSVHPESGLCCRLCGFVRPFCAQQQFGSPMGPGD